MAQNTQQKQVNALMTLYLSSYAKRWGAKPDFNRFQHKWGFQDMLEDLGYEKAQEVILYFFGLKRAEHGVYTLLNNYHRYVKIIRERAEDREKRHEIRARTARIVQEAEDNGNGRSGSS